MLASKSPHSSRHDPATISQPNSFPHRARAGELFVLLFSSMDKLGLREQLGGSTPSRRLPQTSSGMDLSCVRCTITLSDISS